jgi:hypothetical protein
MGNRGGRFHCEQTGTVKGRPWAGRRWICCQLAGKGRKRQVWGHGYTELFFLDEVTALAAGHRPCFECRREAALAFQSCFPRPRGEALPGAEAMDRRLDTDRRHGRTKRLATLPITALPDGTMLLLLGHPCAVAGDALLPWSPQGYGAPIPRPKLGEAQVLTPLATVEVLLAGYRVGW